MSNSASQQEQELWNTMQQINNCWYKGPIQQLAEYFDDQVVFNSPDFKHQIIGKDSCIKTYADFMSISKVLLYKESNENIKLFGSTGIVTYDFEMKYEQKGKTYHEAGTDIVIFNRSNKWKAVWRALANLKNL